MKACFFANAPRDVIRVVGFYQNDIRILRELGFDVRISNKISNIPKNCDLYFAYWASSGSQAVLVSKLLRKPSIIVAAGSDVSKNDPTGTGYNARPGWHKAVIKWTLKNADKVLADSMDVLDQAKELGAKNISLSYFGVDLEKYKPVSGPKRNTFILVSHLSRQNVERKRMADILYAMKLVSSKVKDAKFVFLGTHLDGYPILKKIVEELQLEDNVEFIESRKLLEDDKIKHIQKSIAFVQPSLHEGFGLAMVEAMACGLPVIVTRSGATPEIAGNSAIYVPVEDPKALANAMLKILKSDSYRKKYGAAARERAVKMFDFKRRKEEIRQAIEEVMSK